jgi:hypothetical protein
MRHIDAFCHFFPPRFFQLVSQTSGGTMDVAKRMQGVRLPMQLIGFQDLPAQAMVMPLFSHKSE